MFFRYGLLGSLEINPEVIRQTGLYKPVGVGCLVIVNPGFPVVADIHNTTMVFRDHMFSGDELHAVIAEATVAVTGKFPELDQ